MSYNKVVQVAILRAKPAQGDRLAHLLSSIRDHAVDKEPGTLEYRLVRNQDEFVCFEVYADQVGSPPPRTRTSADPDRDRLPLTFTWRALTFGWLPSARDYGLC